ncbi:phosphorylase [Leptospira adleri]|uniref:Phosphorylase n=1 Tax=Leptospira adleri TaxID=2023186 RepID=A0A2M9YU11_9LEPT|nr:phosphorylase [Leptospira adleri]PJZ55022.1 phosphorylase [Leptospira adleri]PJZ63724.1 phosphorylase [Leptospira adleri]
MKIDSTSALFCSAISDELDRFQNSQKWNTFLCGIGNLEAGLGLQKFLLEKRNLGQTLPSQIVFLGSAGVYPWLHPSFWKGRFGYSYEFQNQEIAKIEKRIRIPEIVPDKFEFISPFQLEAVEEILPSKTNGTGSVTIETVSGKSLEFLRANDLGFENMECFGLARVCEEFNIPFCAFFALTNTVGPTGSEEWKQNYRRESIRLQDFLLSFFL